jgi:hypothetical protein
LVIRAQVTQLNGRRISTAHAYLHPHSHRSNLHIATSSHVTRVLFDANKGVCRSLMFSMPIAIDNQVQLPLAWNTCDMVVMSSPLPLALRCRRCALLFTA